MKIKVIDVGRDFSALPQGRFYSDSPNSAEAFFVHVLEDWLSDGHCVELDFSQTIQVGSCFLQHLAEITVANHYTNYIKVVKDNDWGSVIPRWDRYLAEGVKWKPMTEYIEKEIKEKGFRETMMVELPNIF